MHTAFHTALFALLWQLNSQNDFYQIDLLKVIRNLEIRIARRKYTIFF